MKKPLIAFAAVAVLILLAGPARADLITLNNIGGPHWEVVVNNVPPGTVVGGFDIDIGYDPLIMHPMFVEWGLDLGEWNPALGPGQEAIVGAELVSPGIFNIQEVSLLPVAVLSGIQPASGTFVLATLSFGLADPFGPFGTPEVLRADVSDGFGNPIGAAPVPEPGTVLLLGSGLAVLARWRKRLA